MNKISNFKINKTKFLLIPIFIAFLSFTRFYNLDSSATFFWDQTEFLVKTHQIFTERKITLIGAVSENGLTVWSSLTNYMLMPFVVLGNFDPLSISVGAAFWGVIVAISFLLLTKKVNAKFILFISILVLIWFPLIETSRWAWNPNLIPFWIALGLFFYQFKKPLFLFVSGLSLGLAVHHHYLAVFAVGVFGLIGAIALLKDKRAHSLLAFGGGFLVAVLPFVLFDLRHPPGLFLTRVLYFNQVESKASVAMSLIRVWDNLKLVFFYYTHSTILSVLLGLFATLLLIFDIRKKLGSLVYFGPWLFQIIAVAFIQHSYQHYLLPGLVFFFTWLIYPREKIGEILSKGIVCVLILGSFFTIIPQMKTNPFVDRAWQPNTKTVREIVNIMQSVIEKENLEKVNVVALGSQDTNTYGLKYRNLLLIKGVGLLTKDQYPDTDHLFVISQSPELQVRSDPAYEMTNFREGKLKGKWNIGEGDWVIYAFDRGK
jgi:hypothetical protein